MKKINSVKTSERTRLPRARMGKTVDVLKDSSGNGLLPRSTIWNAEEIEEDALREMWGDDDAYVFYKTLGDK